MKTNTQTHTPSIENVFNNIPLFVENDGESGGLEELAKCLGIKHDIEISQEDLASKCSNFIVKAVNCHEELIEALKYYLDCDLYDHDQITANGDHDENSCPYCRAKQVIAKAQAN